MKKTFLSIMFLLSIGSSISFANIWHSQDDCFLVQNTGGNFTDIIEQRTYSNLITPDVFQRALLNLKAHCCTEVIKKTAPSCVYDIENGILPDVYPQSKYLFDHLLDVNMRKLDGDLNLMYNDIDEDPKGKSRRDSIDEIAEGDPLTNTIGNIDTIQKEVLMEGEKKIIQFKDIKACDLSLDSETNTIFSDKNTNYNNLNLIEKYRSQCAIIACAYYRLTEKEESRRVNQLENSFYQCKRLMGSRINKEKLYVKTIMVQKAIEQIEKTNQKYLGTYFVESRFMNLWKLLFEFVDAFTTVTKSVSEGTKMCN